MGELPRSMQLVVDRTLVGTIAPGTRVTAIGIYSIYQARRAAAAGLSRACCPQGPCRPREHGTTASAHEESGHWSPTRSACSG